MEGKGIVIDHPVHHTTAFEKPFGPAVGWRPQAFSHLIQTQGYDALIDRAMRCPCVDKANGQALSTCRNCLGRGWFFINRASTRVVAQHMDSRKSYQEYGEINRGTASITTKGIDKLGFMDRIILTQLEEFYSEVLRPTTYNGRLIAYPIYEPLEVFEIFMFIGDDRPLKLLERGKDYEIVANRIDFKSELADEVESEDINKPAEMSVTIRYSHYPVYHVIDINRELMKVRESKHCSISDDKLTDMPINVTARKAHYIFDAQKYDSSLIENTHLNV